MWMRNNQTFLGYHGFSTYSPFGKTGKLFVSKHVNIKQWIQQNMFYRPERVSGIIVTKIFVFHFLCFKYETAKLRRSTRWMVYEFWGSILILFPILGIHSIKVKMEWTNFLGIHSVSKGRHRVDRLFGDPPGSPFPGSIQ